MNTVQLEINDSVYDNVMEFLSKFKKNEINIVIENSHLTKNREFIANEISKIDSGNVVLHSQEEFESRIEKILSNYEN